MGGDIHQEPFSVELVEEGDAVRIVARGEVDLATAPEFERVIASTGSSKRVVIDLGGVTFIDSSGLRALLLATEHLGSSNGLRIENATGSVRRVIELCGADKLLPLDGDD
jgi:anti-anti-sigma factor